MEMAIAPFCPYVADAPSPTCIRAAGEIDMATTPILRDQLQAALASRTSYLAVDMADVTFIDSSGLNALIAARSALVPDGDVVLRHVPPVVRRTLSIAGLLDVFPIEDCLACRGPKAD